MSESVPERTPYTVAIVEDHALTRAGLRTELHRDPELDVVGEAEDGIAGLELIERLRPDVAVIDIGLPGIDGIELTRRIRQAVPSTRVAILTMHELEGEVLAALAAGADAYCVKSSPPEQIVAAVRAAAAGNAFFDAKIATTVMRHLTAPGEPAAAGASTDPGMRSPLTPRETDVLRMVADGKGNGEIALALFLGLGTVKGHVRDILEKLAAADRTQAAVTALRRGLI